MPTEAEVARLDTRTLKAADPEVWNAIAREPTPGVVPVSNNTMYVIVLPAAGST